MTLKRFFRYLLAVSILIILMGGCIAGRHPTPTSAHVTTQAEFLLTNTSALTATGLPIPTVMTLMLTPIPTLPADDAYARIGEYLTDSTECHLPCWLGITPGQTTLVDIHELLVRFAGIAIDTTEGYVVDDLVLGSMTVPYYLNDGVVIKIRSSFLMSSDENEIFMVGVDTKAYRITGDTIDDLFGDPIYNEIFKSYTLTRILSTHGQPSQIYVTASLRDVPLANSPAFGDYFEIYLWYPERGIFTEYKMLAESAGDNYKFCPADAFIMLHLIPPGSDMDYKTLLRKSGGWDMFFPPSKFVKTPEEAFGIPDESFYNLFNSPTDRCLETPKLMWLQK